MLKTQNNATVCAQTSNCWTQHCLSRMLTKLDYRVFMLVRDSESEQCDNTFRNNVDAFICSIHSFSEGMTLVRKNATTLRQMITYQYQRSWYYNTHISLRRVIAFESQKLSIWLHTLLLTSKKRMQKKNHDRLCPRLCHTKEQTTIYALISVLYTSRTWTS